MKTLVFVIIFAVLLSACGQPKILNCVAIPAGSEFMPVITDSVDGGHGDFLIPVDTNLDGKADVTATLYSHGQFIGRIISLKMLFPNKTIFTSMECGKGNYSLGGFGGTIKNPNQKQN
jgi:hypothetical protein